MDDTIVRIDEKAYLLISDEAYIVLTKKQILAVWKFCEEMLAED